MCYSLHLHVVFITVCL